MSTPTLGLHITQSRKLLYTLGLKVGIISELGAPGLTTLRGLCRMSQVQVPRGTRRAEVSNEIQGVGLPHCPDLPKPLH